MTLAISPTAASDAEAGEVARFQHIRGFVPNVHVCTHDLRYEIIMQLFVVC